jgi:signal peptidase I
MAKAEKEDGGIVEFVKTVLWALVIAGAFRTLLFQPFWIPSGSMKNTLLIGDFLFVNKMAYGYSRYSCPFAACPFSGRLFAAEPERGDVVVFRHPVNGQDFIKRLIGLPGDTVQVTDGIVSINGTVVPQEPVGTFDEVYERQGPLGEYPRCKDGAKPAEGGSCLYDRARETLPNGVVHDVLNIGNTAGLPDDTGIYTVPEGQYFFMGDNRDNSTDSRFPQPSGGVGFVPAENLIGRADRIIFSSAGRSLLYFWTWRADRFFKAVE